MRLRVSMLALVPLLWTPNAARGVVLDGPRALADSIRAVVRECHPDSDAEKVEIEELPSLATFALGPLDHVVELIGPSEPCAVGRLSFLVRVQEGSRVLVKPVAVDVRHYRKALVLKHSLERGAEIGESDVESAWLDMTHRSQTLIPSLAEAGSISMRRQAVAGTPLTTLLVEETPLVRRGDAVKVIYVRDGLEIQMEGIAQRSGAYGDEIEVRNPASGRVVTGIVTDVGLVEK